MTGQGGREADFDISFRITGQYAVFYVTKLQKNVRVESEISTIRDSG